MKIYEYTYGLVTTEQDFIEEVDSFLTSTVGGWSRIGTISDTSSDRDFVWMSPGEDPDNYRGVFIRLRGYNNNIYTYGYGSWTDGVTYGHELYNSTYSYLAVGSYPLRYWMWGDKDFVAFAIINGSTGNTYTGYLGLIESTYVPETDPLPLLIRGHSSEDYTWSDGSGQLLMHGTVASGEVAVKGYDWNSILTYDRGARETKLLLLPVVLKCEQASNHEVRGRPKGVYQVNDARAPKIAPITSASGVFLIFRDGDSGQSNQTYAYGPVASGIDGFSMW